MAGGLNYLVPIEAAENGDLASNPERVIIRHDAIVRGRFFYKRHRMEPVRRTGVSMSPLPLLPVCQRRDQIPRSDHRAIPGGGQGLLSEIFRRIRSIPANNCQGN